MADELKPCPFCGKRADRGNPKFEKEITCVQWDQEDSTCQNDAVMDAEHWNTRPLEDALRAELAAAQEELDSIHRYEHEIDKAMQSTEQLLEDLAAARQRIKELEAANRWIPVGERLPEPHHNVLVWIDVADRIDVAEHYDEVQQWTTAGHLYYHGNTYEWITHWRPLPEPPSPEA